MNIPLFIQTSYSLLEGVLPPAKLVGESKSQGYQDIVLCDHGFLIGAIEFSLACKEQNLHPILGLEIDVQPPPELSATNRQNNRLLLLAKNTRGWSHLCQLSSLMQTSHSPVSLPNLVTYSDGLICLSGGRNGWIETLIQQKRYEAARDGLVKLSKIFTSDFYLQVTKNSKIQSSQEKLIIDLAKRLEINICAVPFAIYTNPIQSKIQQTLLAIKHNCTIREVDEKMGYDPDAVILPMQQAIDIYQDIPLALENCLTLLDKIHFEIATGIPRLPEIQIQDGKSPEETLRQRAYSGASKLYKEITGEIDQRLRYELSIIHAQGFEPIFLIMEEALNYARQQGILFSSRGSAASSLVAHCLGITSPDPMRLGLYFERFLNPARKTPPDIDTDIDSNRRDELIQYMFTQYGREKVTMVGTINRFRPRSAVGDVAKACGIALTQARKLSRELPSSFFTSRFGKDDSTIFEDLRQKYPQPVFQEVFDRAQSILGLPRHLSMHPGGVVISPTPTTDLTPISFSGSKEVTITQFDLDSLESLGLVKLDLLGIRGLSVMASVANSIYSWRRKEYANPGMVLEDIPETDPLTSDLISTGKTIGCFQIESPGMRSTLKQIHARTIDDVMAALALYRPGPMRGGLRDAFIARHNHQEPVTQIHPALKNVLADTYGVILYQEQVLRIANQVAGLSLADSDLLRRAMSHFDPGKQMQLLKEKFIRGAEEKNQIDRSTAEIIWEMMAAFAGYGFPKAHAASYAQIAWRSAWCKTHFPAEFIAAVLANWGGYYSQRIYLMETRRLGLTVKPPHINHSNLEFSVTYAKHDPELYMGLNQVRGLTQRTITKIFRNRPFIGLNDFILRVDPRFEEVSNLINCGALDGLENIDLDIKSTMQNRFTGQLSLFEMDSAPLPAKPVTDRQRELDQESILGISLDSHPLEMYRSAILSSGALSTSDALAHLGQKIQVVAVCQLLHRSRTSSGSWMAYLTIEDLEGMLEVVLTPEVYRRTPGTLLAKSSIIMVEGIVEFDENSQEPVLWAEKILPFIET